MLIICGTNHKTRSHCMSAYDSHIQNTIKFKLFYIFVTPLCDIIRAHSPHPVHVCALYNLRISLIKMKPFKE